MPAANVFRALGLFVLDDFLSSSECAGYRAAMARSRQGPAVVWKDRYEERVDDTRRKVQLADVDQTIESSLSARLSTLKPRLEAHFGCWLAACERPQFLTYGPGDFYHPHSDGTPDVDAPDHIQDRRVSLVLFLNDAAETSRPDCYGGGELVFHGLMRHASFEICPLPFQPRAGTLAGFPAAVVHEVRPVTFGQRMTVATWWTGEPCIHFSNSAT